MLALMAPWQALLALGWFAGLIVLTTLSHVTKENQPVSWSYLLVALIWFAVGMLLLKTCS